MKMKEELQQKLTAEDVIARENTNLRQQLNRLREELEGTRKKQVEEVAELRKDMFEARMKVESTFRKMLKNIEKEYKARAYETMAEESRKALEENLRLNGCLGEKRDEVLGKMKRQKSKEMKMKRDKINRDIMENSVGMQEQEIGE